MHLRNAEDLEKDLRTTWDEKEDSTTPLYSTVTKLKVLEEDLAKHKKDVARSTTDLSTATKLNA